MKGLFEKDIEIREKEVNGLQKRSGGIGLLKLAILVLLAGQLYLIYRTHAQIWTLVLFGVLVIALVATAIYHSKLTDQIDFENGLIKIDQKNLARIDGKWSSFDDVGEEFVENNHPYSMDLDIVGKKSIFQFLNSTNTFYGRKRFAEDLLDLENTKEQIVKRQKAIEELGTNYGWAQRAEYYFSQVGVDPTIEELLLELQKEEHFISNKLFRILLKILPLAMLVTAIFLPLYVAEGILGLQIVLWVGGFVKIQKYIGEMRRIGCRSCHYGQAFRHILDYNFVSDSLNEIQESAKEANDAIQKLERLVDHINQCQNGMAFFILNLFLLWDYRNAMALDHWRSENGKNVEKWFEAVGELESLLSFANLPRVCDNVSLPVPSETTNYIDATMLGHPLIDNEHRISNSFRLRDNIFIITGSNMSGKTTFMRTVGVNLVLARCGSYICGDHMEFALMNVVTSMRVADDLTQGISTFYAELKRIKLIVDYATIDSNYLFLIDEIFRGTNSADRLKGAKEVLKRLYQLGACGMITSHDLEICKLAEEYEKIQNYSFNETYEEGEIQFPYRLLEGRSQTTNAEFLLRKIGIIS